MSERMLYSGFRLRGPFLNVPEWRNWQTRGTQNPVGFTPRVGSIPSSGTIRLGRYAPSLMAGPAPTGDRVEWCSERTIAALLFTVRSVESLG